MTLQSAILAGNARLEQAGSGGPSVKRRPPGDEADAVRRVQNALVALGFPLPSSFPNGAGGGAPDGPFGNETFLAVQKFQKQAFPAPPSEWDGRVGKNTLAEMDRRLPRAPCRQPSTVALLAGGLAALEQTAGEISDAALRRSYEATASFREALAWRPYGFRTATGRRRTSSDTRPAPTGRRMIVAKCVPGGAALASTVIWSATSPPAGTVNAPGVTLTDSPGGAVAASAHSASAGRSFRTVRVTVRAPASPGW